MRLPGCRTAWERKALWDSHFPSLPSHEGYKATHSKLARKLNRPLARRLTHLRSLTFLSFAFPGKVGLSEITNFRLVICLGIISHSSDAAMKVHVPAR